MTRAISLVLALAVAACGPSTPAEFEGDDAGECGDGADNDRDGSFDCADSDCAASPVCGGGDAGRFDAGGEREGDDAGECSNGIDDDGDGARDCGDTECYADPVCADPPDGGPWDGGLDAQTDLDGALDPDASDLDGAIDPGLDGSTDATVAFDAPPSDAPDAFVPPDAPPPPPPVAYRLLTLTAEDPRPSGSVLGCMDLTSLANGLLEPQEHLIVFPSLERTPTMQPVQLVVRPACTTAAGGTSCGVDVDSVITEDVATTSGTSGEICLAPVPMTTAPSYTPAMPAHPCFSTEGARLEIQTEQDDIILHDVRIAARFDDAAPGTLVEGLLYGFLFEGVAMSVDFTLGGVDRTLWDMLPGGGACMGGDQREIHMSMSGWWAYFHFTAERVEWAP